MTTYLLAGGGTAGHVNPLLAVADAIRAREPEATVLVLGTKEGLEARLVPLRGYELLIVDKVPFPRRPNSAALRFPARFTRAIGQVRSHIRERAVPRIVETDLIQQMSQCAAVELRIGQPVEIGQRAGPGGPGGTGEQVA